MKTKCLILIFISIFGALPGFLFIFAVSNFNFIMLFNQKFISSLEDKCNSMECPVCGRHHRVSLSLRGDVIFPVCEGGVCEGFKEAVNNLLITECRRHLNDPFPYLR
jgi:hypothetical protein